MASSKKSSGLTMSSATYARSTSGKKTLKNSFNEDITKMVNILNGDKYKTFKSTVSQNWVGADASDFLNDVDKTRANLAKKLKELKALFNSAMDEDDTVFNAFQAKNIK